MFKRLGTIAVYKSAWNKWVRWCYRKQIDPVCAPLSEILNYLSTLFENGLQYRPINSHRSAISAYHSYVNGKPVGKHPRVCVLLTGLQSDATTVSLYIYLGFEIVLVYLKTNMSDNSQLSDKDLIHKSTVLMALSSASRASLILHLIKFISRNDNCYMFYFHKPYKSWRKGKAPSTVSYQPSRLILTFVLLRY